MFKIKACKIKLIKLTCIKWNVECSTFDYDFHPLSNWKPSSTGRTWTTLQLHDRFCFKKILFLLYFLLFKILREKILTESWIENISIVLLNLVELIHSVCVKNIIYITKTWTLLRLGAMLLLYEHYLIAGVLATRPNVSRKMMFVSFWSECFVTGRAREGTIPRFIAFNIFEPRTHLCASI